MGVDVGVLGYLDAGSGSMLVSGIAAAAAGIAVAVKMGAGRMLGVVSPKRRKAMKEAKAEDAGTEPTEDAEAPSESGDRTPA
jgi:hypothetical protein